jgi:hypothetical protein
MDAKTFHALFDRLVSDRAFYEAHKNRLDAVQEYRVAKAAKGAAAALNQVFDCLVSNRAFYRALEAELDSTQKDRVGRAAIARAKAENPHA